MGRPTMWAAAGAAVGAVAGASVAMLGNACVDYALVPGPDGKTGRMRKPDRAGGDLDNGSVADECRTVVLEHRAALAADRDAWLAATPVERETIASADGRFALAGYRYPAKSPSKAWVVLVHGYTGDHTEVELLAAQYAHRGFNVLAPDLRAQGESGGDFIGMGWTDRLDLIAWVEHLLHRFGPDIDVVLHGHSMGGATVCMASGEPLPQQVRAIVSDCAYTSVWELFGQQIRKLSGLPPTPLLASARLMLKARGGYDLKRASAIDQVRNSAVPTLFVHGEADGFIPVAMSRELFAACAAPEKGLLVVAGAGHALSAQTDPALYFGTVFAFLDRIGATP